MFSIRSLSYIYTKRLSCKANEIYNVALDIKNYKNFIPYIVDSFDTLEPCSSPNHRGNGDNSFQYGTGGFTINWNGYKETINCDISFKTDEQIISECKVGIFKHLKVEWNFIPVKPAIITSSSLSKFRNHINDGCNVRLTLDYEFKSSLYNKLSSLINSTLGKLMVKAFEDEVIKRQRIGINK